jgi:hypothetical protein
MNQNYALEAFKPTTQVMALVTTKNKKIKK